MWCMNGLRTLRLLSPVIVASGIGALSMATPALSHTLSEKRAVASATRYFDGRTPPGVTIERAECARQSRHVVRCSLAGRAERSGEQVTTCQGQIRVSLRSKRSRVLRVVGPVTCTVVSP